MSERFKIPVVTYHETLHNPDNEQLLILWRKTWESFGHPVFVLTREDALEHELYVDMLQKAEELPTVNQKNFEVMCFIRWCAVAMFEQRCAFLDFDVFPCEAFTLVEIPTSGLIGYGVPGFVVGDPCDFEKVIHLLLEYEPGDQTHVSDMTIMQERKDHIFDQLHLLSLCYGLDGWEKSPLVHFGNAYVKGPRLELVKETLKTMLAKPRLEAILAEC